ncbi:Uncharacterised protein [Klebsiella pneumoniae]|uniref:Uncharacterized protein n=1 Tax=Klebsiella pneumoniae TaxID=573 RepID=A0A377WM60_KLEPN|nr:Uncharacterised protein [Klebsiella pneumoniae]
MRKTLQALGRLKAGQMNKTETAYAQELELRKRYGKSPGTGSKASSCVWLTTRSTRLTSP